MTFSLKITILARLLLFFVYFAEAQQRPMLNKAHSRKTDLVDFTRGLSDAEIEAALGDLTLSDLNVLSNLIDSSNNADYDYDDDSFLNSNEKQHTFYNPRSDDEAPGYEEYEIEEQPRRQSRRIVQFKMPRGAMAAMLAQNQRIKRENAQAAQSQAQTQVQAQPQSQEINKIHVDEEYLKQLENSFPRDQEQNNNEDYEGKKDHVRVKRN